MTRSSVGEPVGGQLSGRHLLTAILPAAKGFSRGYDRKAVDRLLIDCAKGVDELTGLLVAADDEIERLTRQVQAQAQRRAKRSSAVSNSSKRRPRRSHPGARLLSQKDTAIS